ncbi:uncharacterized protein LOC105204570 [Solenopsis invicta]|uniref:uncharacterized protein LOC105204570 n=1 Tax=Solenopsis invicta TaxID=13686 RepID=UPI00193E76BC|nr:uncharacterized protein LOC105204570 [Solenopsis invicta]
MRCGGSGWMQEDCARRVRKRERGRVKRGRGGRGGRGGRRGGGLGATSVMSVCTRTPSRLRRWRNVATQPHRERRASLADRHSDARWASEESARPPGSDDDAPPLRRTSRIAALRPTTTTTPVVATTRRRRRRRRRRRGRGRGRLLLRRSVCARDFVSHVAAVKCVYATAQRQALAALRWES